MVSERAVFPDLAALPPGLELAALLEAVDLPDLPDEAVVPVLIGAWRQMAHLQALIWTAMTELTRREPPPQNELEARWLRREPRMWAVDQIAAGLRLTRRRADRELDTACQLATELPMIGPALAAGQLDATKAWLYCQYLTGLTPEQITLICERTLPLAPQWTSGQLAHRLLREVQAIDPTYRRRRYERAIQERGVCGHLSEDGTATLSAHGLTPTEAAAAAERLEQLAAAVRAAGHPDTETHLRADLFVRLLDGRYQGFTRDQIITAMLTEAAATAAATAENTDPETNPKPQPRSAPRRRTGQPSRRGGPARTAGCGTGRAGRVNDQTEPATTTQPAAPAAPSTATAPATAPASTPESPDQPTPVPPEQPRTGIEIRVGLLTLLGHNNHPAELPGWGPILADHARDTVTRQHQAEWRFAILDNDGYLIIGGLLRRRPTRCANTPPCRGGVVELHIHADQLPHLAERPDLPDRWGPVINEIQHHYTNRKTELAQLDEHPDTRFPTASLRRHIQIRDRTCTAPGCRRPARKADIDHTTDHAHGGPTTSANTEPLCPLHHAMKHHRGWQLTQPEPGHFHWRSPLGQHYYTRGEPIAPDLPDPIPDPQRTEQIGEPIPAHDDTAPIYDPAQWDKIKPPDEDEPAQPDADDEPPPF